MSLVAIAGCEGGIKHRLDIRDFVKNEKFFTLYVRALEIMPARDQNDWTSWFQICGIHGLPFREWAKERPSFNAYEAGYCTHGMDLFPTLHRPYVCLYEQTMQAAAIEAAKKFTVDKEAWKQAAQDIRQPFWDWASDLVPPDQVIKNERIQIVDYNGTEILVGNPILRYRFRLIDSSFRGYRNFEQWPTTVRNPDRNGKEDIPALIKKLGVQAPQLREKTYNMLMYADTWEEFSNHAVGDLQHANSLEAVHDEVHSIVGYGQMRGHMVHPFFAAFDPIFWLHHSNTDRLLAIWHAIHPNVWVSRGINRDATMSIASNTEVTIDTPLEPFYETPDKVWTSASLTDTSKLGYIYPEFARLVGGSKDLIQEAMENYVAEHYGHRHEPSAFSPARNILSNFKGLARVHDEHREMWDWIIHVTFKKYELDESFSLLFYFAVDGGSFDQKESFVGSISTFRGTTPRTCANCRNNADLVQQGFVHLNSYFARDIGSFEPDKVHEYLLKKKLSYQLFTDEEKPLTSLDVRVEARPLILSSGSTRPTRDTSRQKITFRDVVSFVSA